MTKDKEKTIVKEQIESLICSWYSEYREGFISNQYSYRNHRIEPYYFNLENRYFLDSIDDV